MKKIDAGKQFVQQNLMQFRCPTCGARMESIQGNSLVCEHHHQLDFNKQGSLYFMQKAMKAEYTREMLVSRRELLQAGLFEPLVEAINQQLGTGSQSILDVGCGEGTPLAYLETLRSRKDLAIGFDISKAGIGLATQLMTNAWFCVADLRHLPFQNHSFDTVMEIFSPSDYAEFNRVLKPGGQLIKVIPNADYLVELRHLLYPSGTHASYDNTKVIDLFREHYPDGASQVVQYSFTVPEQLRAQMVEMTPLHWGKDALQLGADDLAKLEAVTVDVTILSNR